MRRSRRCTRVILAALDHRRRLDLTGLLTQAQETTVSIVRSHGTEAKSTSPERHLGRAIPPLRRWDSGHEVWMRHWERWHTTTAAEISKKDQRVHVDEKGRNGQKGVRDDEDRQQMSTQAVLRKLGSYLWPKDHPELKRRVVGSVFLLISGKLLNIQVHR